MNFVRQARKVIRFGSLRHRGCEVTVRDTGYEVFGVMCKDKSEVDSEIDRRLVLLNSSLNRIKPSMQIVK